MGGGVSVEALYTIHGGDTADQTLLLKQGQVAVHRTHRQIGDLGLEFRKEHFGGGVRFGAPQALQYGIALFEVLLYHSVTSQVYLRMILIYELSITYAFLFVNRNYSYFEKIFYLH
jgi:hypothetical protein